MGRFYLDIDFTNGNYYLADIIEIALIAEESRNIFHSYVKIHYSIPRRVQQLTNISNKTVKYVGLSFRIMMDALNGFLCCEQAQSETIPIIIAHGGFLNDFTILLANCAKHEYDNYSLLLGNCTYVDSMLMFQNAGYARPGLDALSRKFNIVMRARKYHSALHDAELLLTICIKRVDLLLLDQHSLTFNDILLYLNEKLPIPIWRVFKLAR